MKNRETLHYFRVFFKLNIVTVAQLVESCATVFFIPYSADAKKTAHTIKKTASVRFKTPAGIFCLKQRVVMHSCAFRRGNS